MIHHIMHEKHIENVCPYCKNEVKSKDFKIELVEGVNYKSTKCKCGKKLMVRVDKEMFNHRDGGYSLLTELIKFEDEKLHKKGEKHDKRHS